VYATQGYYATARIFGRGPPPLKTAAGAQPNWFVIAGNDRMIAPGARDSTRRGWVPMTFDAFPKPRTHAFDTGQVADFLIGAAASLRYQGDWELSGSFAAPPARSGIPDGKCRFW